jgi:hypothetical protein
MTTAPQSRPCLARCVPRPPPFHPGRRWGQAVSAGRATGRNGPDRRSALRRGLERGPSRVWAAACPGARSLVYCDLQYRPCSSSPARGMIYANRQIIAGGPRQDINRLRMAAGPVRPQREPSRTEPSARRTPHKKTSREAPRVGDLCSCFARVSGTCLNGDIDDSGKAEGCYPRRRP